MFLRKDCWNVNAFFKSKGVLVCSCREYTDFVTLLGLEEGDVDQYLSNLMDKVAERGELSDKEKLDDIVFRDSHIARRLDQIKMTDAERDLISASVGDTSEILYNTVMGLDESLKPQGKVEVIQEEDEVEVESEEDEEDDDFVHPKSKVDEPVDKKAHKKAVKEANRERRKTKMPKHEKKG